MAGGLYCRPPLRQRAPHMQHVARLDLFGDDLATVLNLSLTATIGPAAPPCTTNRKKLKSIRTELHYID